MRSNSVANIEESAVRDALRRGWLGGAALRKEDEQKAAELVPLLGEVARIAARLSTPGPFTLVDACAGKGALGVLASLLVLGERPHAVTVLEREDRHTARCLDAARLLGVAERVRFVVGDVADAPRWPAAADLVVALHACGGASDAVLDAVVRTDARALLLVPCCYGAGPRHDGAGLGVHAQELADAWVARLPLPTHGLVGKRVSQSLVDAERTLRLESAGWETEVLEVFAATLSPHNLLWRARRVKEPVRMQRARAKLDALRAVELTGRGYA